MNKKLQSIKWQWFLWGGPIGILAVMLGGKGFISFAIAGIGSTFVIAPFWAVVVHNKQAPDPFR